MHNPNADDICHPDYRRKMTLAEWQAKYNAFVGMHGNGVTRYVYAESEFTANHFWDLHHLIDYSVTSHTGGSIWLTPREYDSACTFD